MSFKVWKLPIEAKSHRSNELQEVKLHGNELSLLLSEKDTEIVWRLTFKSIQAFRCTTEECSGTILERLPSHGGFFVSTDSAWLDELGKGTISFLETANHFVVCCYDEIIEIISSTDSIDIRKIGIVD